MDFPEAVFGVVLTAVAAVVLGFGLGANSIREECKTYHELRIDGKKYSCNISRPEGQETK